MARTEDLNPLTTAAVPALLPKVDWASLEQTEPKPIPLGARNGDDRLPHADVVVITWTSAEWQALDHVFLSGIAARTDPAHAWRSDWLLYSRGASSFVSDPQSGALWGYFQMVEITDRSGRPWRVLLFKSDTHLAHSPWIEGLSAMMKCILKDVQPDRVYSIGTAGGARLAQRLGDSVITNCAMLDVQRPTNTLGDDNGSIYRCQTWFPATSLVADVERSLLYRMNHQVNDAAFDELFAQLQAKHADDGALDGITLADLVNAPLQANDLGSPHIFAMPDIPLLTTDFYYIAGEAGADAHSFLEMDDAVIAREAAIAGVRFAFIRNISDPIVPSRTAGGAPIPDTVRGDWSGFIYNRYGLFTSFNGALAAWATIAGEGSADYNPPRNKTPEPMADPLEVKLAYQVRSCGTCDFFWPTDKKAQPYGPYTAFDFRGSTPFAAPFTSKTNAAPWVLGKTRPPSFPNPEVVDGCRKAPIMTIGINPNLTAFAPGQTGTAWCYPNFTSDEGTDAWTKYAWYYRYRSVYQERLDFDFARRFLLPEGRIFAAGDGVVTGLPRLDNSPAWELHVRYDGDAADTVIPLHGKTGDFPYVALFDAAPPNNHFSAGDVLAGRLSVPSGIRVEVMQQQQGYYMQFVPVLAQFQDTLRKAGHPADLRIGEDVCQLDMVACASPHWTPGFLGGTPGSVQQIVDNCVSKNAWAMKQLVQTRPAILYIVSVSSWRMFHDAFGAFVERATPLSDEPEDFDFTLLRETTDPANPCTFHIKTTINGMEYECTTRIVITPHFSYNDNFLPQFRMKSGDWTAFAAQNADCVAAMTAQNGFYVVPADTNPKHADYFRVVQLTGDAGAAQALLQTRFPAAYYALQPYFVDPHAAMAGVLDEMYAAGTLGWKDLPITKEQPKPSGYLSRTEGACQFCVNRHWQLPLGCQYGKNKETQPPDGFLEKVAEYVAANGKPSVPPQSASQMRPAPGPLDAPAKPNPLQQAEDTAGPGGAQTEIPPTKDSQ